MITNEDAKKLVARIRECAKQNEASASTEHNDGHRQWLEGRADAYGLAANWLERLIGTEAKR